ncbi:hypothetical protein, partial [Hydrogenibacillus schlegelii]|uniref:hypothetical protein n=1 Tax=Hydrogenibacillus schlegelii TaxID=1484 RepID=UPI0034A07FEC
KSAASPTRRHGAGEEAEGRPVRERPVVDDEVPEAEGFGRPRLGEGCQQLTIRLIFVTFSDKISP